MEHTVQYRTHTQYSIGQTHSMQYTYQQLGTAPQYLSIAQRMSNIVYSLSYICCNDRYIKQSLVAINQFIWSNKVGKIKHKTLMCNYDNAGLRVPDMGTTKKSLRLAWISRLYNTNNRNKIANQCFDWYQD